MKETNRIIHEIYKSYHLEKLENSRRRTVKQYASATECFCVLYL